MTFVRPARATPRRSAAIRARVWWIALVTGGLSLGGCASHQDTPTPAGEKPKAARSELERGPVRLQVSVAPSAARLSDEPKLTVRVDYEPGVEIVKPEFGTVLGDFVIRDFREPLARMEAQRHVWEQIYTLEPTRTGKVTIEPITIRFTDRRPNGTGKESELTSEPLTLDVSAAVVGQTPSLDEIRPMAAPVELPYSGGAWAWSIVVPLIAVAAILVAAWRWRRRRASQAAVELTPAEWAFLELQRLLQEDLANRDVKLFYVELTAVVRRYIERTAGIHAPEQTTQEFLHEISRTAAFPAEEGRRLAHFLEAADLVKFAAFQPRKEDIEESFRRAKVFVGCQPEEVAA